MGSVSMRGENAGYKMQGSVYLRNICSMSTSCDTSHLKDLEFNLFDTWRGGWQISSVSVVLSKFF